MASSGAVGFETTESEHEAMINAPRIAGSERNKAERIIGEAAEGMADRRAPLRQRICLSLTRCLVIVYKKPHLKLINNGVIFLYSQIISLQVRDSAVGGRLRQTWLIYSCKDST